MFSELMPLIQHRPLTITVTAVNETQITVNVIPKATDKDKAANKEISHTHNKEVAAIPEGALIALTTPLSLTGTPSEIDAQLAKTLTEFTAAHASLQNSYDEAATAIKKAVKDIDERERLKKEQDKAKSKKPNGGTKAAEEKKEEPGLPSLFTAPTTPTPVSANDATAIETSDHEDNEEGSESDTGEER